METLLENKTINTFENEISREPSPFYTKESQMFYKNKLVSVEEIIYTKDCSDERNGEFNKHFSIYKPTIEYVLTFEDQHGNTHSFTCDSKPKKIDDLFYYIIKDNHIAYIAHETDKASLKNFIDLDDIDDADYDKVTNKMFKLGRFFDKYYEPISFLCLIICASILPLVFGGLIFCNISIFLSGIAALPGLIILDNFFIKKGLRFFYDKKEQIISDKKEALLNTFK